LSRAEENLGAAIKSGGNEQAQQVEEHIAQLRSDNRELAQKLQNATETNAKLQRAIDAHQQHTDGQSVDELYKKLRQQELDIAQERAEFARLRAEMARAQDETGQLGDKHENLQKTDLRLKALRDHLREIHDEEKEERANKSSNSLTSRISRLWQRLDG